MTDLDLYERELERELAAAFARGAERIAKEAQKGISVVDEIGGKPCAPFIMVTPEATMKLRSARTCAELAAAFGLPRGCG